LFMTTSDFITDGDFSELSDFYFDFFLLHLRRAHLRHLYSRF